MVERPLLGRHARRLQQTPYPQRRWLAHTRASRPGSGGEHRRHLVHADASRGRQFHHGREMTADDVKFSLERLVTPATASEGGGLYTGLDDSGDDRDRQRKRQGAHRRQGRRPLHADDRVEKPDSVLLYLLGLPFASIVPKDVVSDVGDKKFNFAPVGTGPFQMKTSIRPRASCSNATPTTGTPKDRISIESSGRSVWSPTCPSCESKAASRT